MISWLFKEDRVPTFTRQQQIDSHNYLVHSLFVACLLFSSTGCAPSGFKGKPGQTTRASRSYVNLKSCSFADTKTLENVLKQKLGIARGDVPIVDSKGDTIKSADCKQGTSTDCYYLFKYRADLGEAAPAEGRLANPECTPTKFRITTEMFVNACTMAMEDPAIKDKLFPEGIEDFEYLYLTFVGRRPEGSEITVLLELVEQFEGETKKAVAACASVAASLESLTIM